jgi:hypothetical protein
VGIDAPPPPPSDSPPDTAPDEGCVSPENRETPEIQGEQQIAARRNEPEPVLPPEEIGEEPLRSELEAPTAEETGSESESGPEEEPEPVLSPEETAHGPLRHRDAEDPQSKIDALPDNEVSTETEGQYVLEAHEEMIEQESSWMSDTPIGDSLPPGAGLIPRSIEAARAAWQGREVIVDDLKDATHRTVDQVASTTLRPDEEMFARVQREAALHAAAEGTGDAADHGGPPISDNGEA